MTFLGLVGIPATPITYPVYQALKIASPALGAAFAGAEAAAIAGLAVQGAAIVGAGALGWMIGSAIREQLGLDEDPGFVSDWITGGTQNEELLINWTFYNGVNAPISSNTVVRAPLAGPLRKVQSPDFDIFYFRQINPAADVPLVSFASQGFPNARIEIGEITKLDGTPAQNLRRVPAYPQKPVFTPVKVPAIVPSTPRTPAFPITPTVVPTPGNDPDEDNKLREPGITVQIPELGLQIQYTPTGVRYGRYRSPETTPYEPPKIALPPGVNPPASDPCPCPEEEGKDEEIICRVKALQDELLDNGYESTETGGGPSSYINIQNLEDEFYLLKVSVASKPSNVKTQSYTGGAPTVYWVGWLSWGVTDRVGDRTFLQFDEMEFIPPPGATGFTVAANDGCTLVAQAFTRKKKAYIDNCDNLVLT